MATGATPTQQYGGYDEYDFVQPPPDRLLCQICKCPSRDPYMTLCCGHGFCKSCLDGQRQVKSVSYACPMCRKEEPEFKTVPYKALEREIRALHVCCTNKEKGCKWQGELNDVNNHLLNGCQFSELKCSNECGKMIERRYLTSHVETECPHRKVNCQYCHDTGEYQFIQGQHKEDCPKLPLPCPNKCEVGSVPREDMEAHWKECPLEMIQCEYHNVGCEVRMARKDQERHKKEKMEEHLLMMIKGMQPLQNISFNQTSDQSVAAVDLSSDESTKQSPTTAAKASTADSNSKSSTTTSTAHKLPTINREVSDKSESDDEPSTASDECIKSKQKLLSAKDELSASKKDAALQNELTATKKQLFAITDGLLVIKEEVSAVKKALSSNEEKQQEKLNKLESTLNCILEHVQLNPWTLRLCTNSGNSICPVIVMIPNIDNKTRHNEKWLSNPFSTHDKVHTMCLQVIINGRSRGEGTHVSVFLYLMKERCDGKRLKPLVGNFVITLLNQKMDNDHYSLSFTEMTPMFIPSIVSPSRPNEIACASVGSDDFISHEDLENTTHVCQYLKGDCIFIKVEAIVASENPQARPSIIEY